MHSGDNSPTIKEAGEAMRRAALGMGAAFAGLAAAVEHFGRSLYASLWHSYIMAGAPYGVTRKGLSRWMREQQRPNA